MHNFILNLNPNSHVHFIGIGGISMSALAQILHNMNYKVTGSDIKESNITKKLSELGIKIYIGHNSENINNADIIVYTAAINNDNPEMIRAQQLGLTIIERPILLGEIMKKYKYSIGVSGTHGKTTTTSMISSMFLESDLDPTILIGGELASIRGNLKIGNSEYFITEACEYVESFLKLHPFVGIILNIDADHLDYFKDINNITTAFIKYAKLIPKEGFLIINNDDPRKQTIINNAVCNIVSFGIENQDSLFKAKNICFNSKGHPTFDVFYNNTNIGNVSLNVPGIHNVYNALASLACSMTLGVNFNTCKKSLSNFLGAKRRFEYKGMHKNMIIIDDYAHHPTEVKATLAATKNYPHNKIWCIFQPHTYTRTQKLLDEFSKSFNDADKIIITDIYSAREKDTGEIHSKDLVNELKALGKDAIYIHEFDSIFDYISNNGENNDIIITMGAGDIYKVGEQLVESK